MVAALVLSLYDLCFFPALTCMLGLGLLNARGRRFFAQTMGWRNLRQRLALDGAQPLAHVWVHVASLGEVKALAKLLALIKADPRGLSVHLTCMTDPAVTWARANYLQPGLVGSVALMPFDQSFLIRRYLRAMPYLRALVVVETEMWPNLIRCSKRKGLKLFWVNCRLAEGTRRLALAVPGLFRHLAGCFDAVMTCDTASTRFFSEMGAVLPDLSQPGNIKWDTAPGEVDRDGALAARRQAGAAEGDFLFVAASTRPGEEEVVFDAVAHVRKDRPALRLVIAPRHVERAAGLRAALEARGLTATVVSEFGRLESLYSAASAVFVGGTLSPAYGGHNFVEPAAIGRAVMIGPYFSHFQDAGERFIAHKAIAVVRDAAQMSTLLRTWMDDLVDRETYARRARETFHRLTGASQAVWDKIAPLVTV